MIVKTLVEILRKLDQDKEIYIDFQCPACAEKAPKHIDINMDALDLGNESKYYIEPVEKVDLEPDGKLIIEYALEREPKK
jgi:hypothetical protein